MHARNWKIMAMALGACLASCAKSPEQVIPMATPTIEYERMSCAELATARARNLENVSSLSLSQERARSNDTLGVIFLGLPVASMTGADKEGELSVAKGRDLSISSVQHAKKCPE